MVERSRCCHAEVKVRRDEPPKEALRSLQDLAVYRTRWYECQACKKMCDIYYTEEVQASWNGF